MPKQTVKPQRIAVLCSDLHLSLTAPACRADKDWLEVQANYLAQLKHAADDLPILCAGDIFDRWNAPPELIHFALEHLPDGMICIPGQHDLPNHNLSEMHRSAYGVLARTHKIRDISSGKLYCDRNMDVTGFAWGSKLHPYKGQEHSLLVHVAMVHRYLAKGAETAYQGAPPETYLANWLSALDTYDAVLIGDNHIPWTWKDKFFNHGTFIRRKSDEVQHLLGCGYLYDDGIIERHFYNCADDRFYEKPKEREEIAVNMRQFVDSLEGLGEHGLNFREVVTRQLDKEDLHAETKQIILWALAADNKA